MIHDVLIVGGGISGASAGYELAAQATVVVLEGEEAPGYHATGRSAALFTRNFGGPVARRINAASEAFLAHPPEGFCAHPLLRPRGGLTVAAPGGEGALEPVLALSRPGAEIAALSAGEALERAPHLRPDRVAAGAFEAGIRDIDVDHLHQSYLRGLRARGGAVLARRPVRGLRRVGGAWEVDAGGDPLRARVVVDAAGAWAEAVGAMAGARPVGLVPKRRTAILLDAPPGLDPASLPVVDFAGTGAYLKPEAGAFMASPGDAVPCAPGDVRPEEIDVATIADRIERETTIPVRRIKHAWAGLRTFAVDDAPVVGFDAEAPGFFWLAGQGGYGIMMAPALARLAAALCLGAPPPAELAGLVADLAPDRPSLALS